MKDPPEKETLIAIPDISGFSSFVTDTAIEHSQHIVSELLELIIDQNTLGLQVSEIEGDAVLFYKTGALPEVEEIWQWAQQTYLKFHEHLLIYERQRICQCGACKTAHELDLKFIVDQGPTRQVKISSHEKLMGPALIQAHRLLKNDVPSDGYFLLSDGLLEKANASLPEEEGFTWIKGCNHYPHLGEVGYCYTLLEPLHSRVQTPEQRKDHFTIKRPAKEHILLDNDIQTVHQVVSDSSQKIYWVEGVEKVIHSQPDEIEKVGSRHLCVVQGQEIPGICRNYPSSYRPHA